MIFGAFSILVRYFAFASRFSFRTSNFGRGWSQLHIVPKSFTLQQISTAFAQSASSPKMSDDFVGSGTHPAF